MTFDSAALAAPFPADAISWRAQTVTKNGDKALALAYIDARDVQDRLDAVCGPANWQDSYTETVKGRLICTLSIRIGDEWISKSDGAGDTDLEGDKGAISDALKRAAVKWGIGRYLYNLKTVWAPCESDEFNGKRKWKAWKPEAQRVFAAALGQAAPFAAQTGPAPTDRINDTTRDWISDRLTQHQLIVGDLCAFMGVPSLKQLTYAQIDAVKAWLRDNTKKAA